VQLNDLDAAVNLLADLAISPDSRQSKEPILHRHALPLLIGIPLGSAIGGFIATRLAVSTVPWSIGGAVCLSILVTAIYAQCKPTQSDQV
jgi:predicted MFS family arabinose efflux permease